MTQRIMQLTSSGVLAFILLSGILAATAAATATQQTIPSTRESVSFSGMASQFRQPRGAAHPAQKRTILADPAANVITDGGFEAGTPNPYWSEASTNFGTPLCDENCFDDPLNGAHSGLFWAWFGGVAEGYEAGSLSQRVTIPAGTATLSFWLFLPLCDSVNDYFEVSLDSTPVFFVDGGSELCGEPNYFKFEIDLSSYADSGSHNLILASETFAQNGDASNFFVDDVALDVTAGPATATPAATATPTATEGPPATPAATPTEGPPLPQSGPGILLSEVMFYPAAGGYEWVELQNYGASAQGLQGHTLRDEDGHAFRFPQALPAVPSGARVVVIFDGQGSDADDVSFGDGRATLHSPPGMTGIFEDDGDQVALYKTSVEVYLPPLFSSYAGMDAPIPRPNSWIPPQNVISFVAWGKDPAEDGSGAVFAGLWPPETYVDTQPEPGPERLERGGVIGRRPDHFTGSPSDWAIYRPGTANQGERNLPAAPFMRNPADGLAICDRRPTFGWETVGAITSYHFQLDDDPAFGSPLVDVKPTASEHKPGSDLPPGKLYFRVRVLGGQHGNSAWSPANSVTVLQCNSLLSVSTSKQLDITPKKQHKDTHMLNLDGDPETGRARWDSAHEEDGDWTIGNGTPVRASALDNMYCTRASISMIAAYFGGDLSMDYISYWYRGEGEPEGDLGHGKGMWPNGNIAAGSGKQVLNWAMNDRTVTSSRGKPSFNQIKGWIDAGRPLVVVENGDRHTVVLSGYDTNGEKVYRIDPWTATGGWVALAAWPISEYHVPPLLTPPQVARSDPDTNNNGVSDLIDDTDGDGISDFDEQQRFHGLMRSLDPRNPDSDGDGITDKADMRAHVFTDDGLYSRWRPDWDGDGDRKEVDYDNDNYWDTGSSDGCEDIDRNGFFNGTEETSNFDPTEGHERKCVAPEIDITGGSGGTVDSCMYYLTGTIKSDAELSNVEAIISGRTGRSIVRLGLRGTKPDFYFSQSVPIFSGNNLVQVTAANEYGIGNDYATVRCERKEVDIHVQLTWSQLGSDFDLHFIRPGGSYMSDPDDCYWGNERPDWGVPGETSDDPVLDIDCIKDCTVENIILKEAFAGTYTIKVNYFNTFGQGPRSARVRLWVGGSQIAFGPQELDYAQIWDVATVDWQSGAVTVVDEVREARQGESAAKR